MLGEPQAQFFSLTISTERKFGKVQIRKEFEHQILLF